MNHEDRRSILRDFADFLHTLWEQWTVLLTGGSVAMMLLLGERISGETVPHGYFGLIVGLTLLLAGFLSWRKERRLRAGEAAALSNRAAADLQQATTTAKFRETDLRHEYERLRSELDDAALRMRLLEAEANSHSTTLSQELARTVELYRIEKERNARPDLHGAIKDFSSGIRSTGGGSCAAEIHFNIEVGNLRPAVTNLVDARIDGSGLNVPAQFERLRVWKPPVFGSDNTHADEHPRFEPGIFMMLAGSATVIVDGYNWSDLGDTLSLDGLRFELVDGFGTPHQLQVEQGARITV